MPKPAIIILSLTVLVLTVILAVFVIRSDGHDRRERSDQPPPAGSAEPNPSREPSATRPSPPVTGIGTERPPPSPGPRTPVDRSAVARLDESSLLSRLHDLAASDPPRSLALAREAVARFPNSANAPEFEWNVVKALANMDRYQEAEEAARGMLRRFPGNRFTDDVEHHLLNHPPNPPSTPDP